MKRYVILFVISLLTTIASFSQSGYPKNIGDSLVIITAEQLKEVNLVFNEHTFLIHENDLLLEKIDLKDSLIFNYQKMDSINRANVVRLTDEVNFKNKEISTLKTKLKNYKTALYVGSGALIASIIAIFVR